MPTAQGQPGPHQVELRVEGRGARLHHLLLRRPHLDVDKLRRVDVRQGFGKRRALGHLPMGMDRKQERASNARNTKVWLSTKITHRWNHEVRLSTTISRVSRRTGPRPPEHPQGRQGEGARLGPLRVEVPEGADYQREPTWQRTTHHRH